MTRKKCVSFFEESFGGVIKMTEEHFVCFWETILFFRRMNKNTVILIKPKDPERWKVLSPTLKKKFDDIQSELLSCPDVFVVDHKRWSFIECIGVADVVVTQGMTSSATIALISGVEGLYFDQAQYKHPFSQALKDVVVFDNQQKFLTMLDRIVRDEDSALKHIPGELLRRLDAFDDDRGIERLRDILLCDEREALVQCES